MARKRSALTRVRRGSYFLSRDLGDVQAGMRGPVPLGRRLVRRSVTRRMFRLFR